MQSFIKYKGLRRSKEELKYSIFIVYKNLTSSEETFSVNNCIRCANLYLLEQNKKLKVIRATWNKKK